MNMAARLGRVLIVMAAIVSIAVSPTFAQEESESQVR